MSQLMKESQPKHEAGSNTQTDAIDQAMAKQTESSKKKPSNAVRNLLVAAGTSVAAIAAGLGLGTAEVVDSYSQLTKPHRILTGQEIAHNHSTEIGVAAGLVEAGILGLLLTIGTAVGMEIHRNRKEKQQKKVKSAVIYKK